MESSALQEFMLSISGKLSTIMPAMQGRFEISESIWIAVLVGILFGWILGLISSYINFFTFMKRCLGPQRQAQIINELTTQERATAVLSKEFNGGTLVRSTIQIDDLLNFYQKLHYKDGGPPWEWLMERSIPGMIFQAWRRDPQEGPTEYRTRHIFENVTPQTLRDFFWDDELRHEWDDLIKSAKCLEGCTETGENVSHWIKKFPFFCSDREYVMSRRIYECEGVFYCITKVATHDAIPVKKKPRRVPMYSSDWCIRAVESSQTGQMTACEVTFLHSEDLLLQRNLAKLGVRRGMWPLVKRMEPGLRKYQAFRKVSSSLSPSATLAQVFTSVPSSLFEEPNTAGVLRQLERKEEIVKEGHANAWKWVAVGGVVVLACGFGRGPLGRVVMLGVARSFGRAGRRQ